MDINQLLFFGNNDATNQYCTVINEAGQVYYCETDNEKNTTGKWKLVNLDLHAMSLLH